MNTILELNDKVRRNAEARGADGVAWIARLAHLVAELARDWNITIGQTFPNATQAFVAEALRADGEKVVLKDAPGWRESGGFRSADTAGGVRSRLRSPALPPVRKRCHAPRKIGSSAGPDGCAARQPIANNLRNFEKRVDAFATRNASNDRPRKGAEHDDLHSARVAAARETVFRESDRGSTALRTSPKRRVRSSDSGARPRGPTLLEHLVRS